MVDNITRLPSIDKFLNDVNSDTFELMKKLTTLNNEVMIELINAYSENQVSLNELMNLPVIDDTSIQLLLASKKSIGILYDESFWLYHGNTDEINNIITEIYSDIYYKSLSKKGTPYSINPIQVDIGDIGNSIFYASIEEFEKVYNDTLSKYLAVKRYGVVLSTDEFYSRISSDFNTDVEIVYTFDYIQQIHEDLFINTNINYLIQLKELWKIWVVNNINIPVIFYNDVLINKLVDTKYPNEDNIKYYRYLLSNIVSLSSETEISEFVRSEHEKLRNNIRYFKNNPWFFIYNLIGVVRLYKKYNIEDEQYNENLNREVDALKHSILSLKDLLEVGHLNIRRNIV